MFPDLSNLRVSADTKVPVESSENPPHIHYTMAFTWPVSANMTASQQYSSVEWNSSSNDRRGPTFYFSCLLNLIKQYRSEKSKFSVYMHGALKTVRVLEDCIGAVSKNTATVIYCDDAMPPNFPKMQRLVPVIDSTEENTVVICIDIHDSPSRQKFQIYHFLGVMSSTNPNQRLGIATFYPCAGDSYSAITDRDDPEFARVNKAPVMRAISNKKCKRASSIGNLLAKTMRWHVDAGLLMTTSEGREQLRDAYSFDDPSGSGDKRVHTLDEHINVMGKNMDFLVKAVWSGQWGVDEIALSHYLFSFQPLYNTSQDMMTFKTLDDNEKIIKMWSAVEKVFAPYVHTLTERPDANFDTDEKVENLDPIVYKYGQASNRWAFLEQEEVCNSRNKLSALTDNEQIINLQWNMQPKRCRGPIAYDKVYITARLA